MVYLDAYVYGEYNSVVLEFLRQNDALFEISDEDKKALKAAKPDFIGFNYYTTATVSGLKDADLSEKSSQQETKSLAGMYTGIKNPNLEKTEFGWEIDPIGFRNTLREIYSRYHLPMLITENGLGAYDKLEGDKVHDPYRIEYLRKHINQLQLALSDGCEIMGYMPWSAIDLVSTHEGIRKRYGFIYVNREDFDLKDLKRYRKDSFFWCQKVIKTNGSDLS